jgi:hypothetical protein
MRKKMNNLAAEEVGEGCNYTFLMFVSWYFRQIVYAFLYELSAASS